MSHERTHAHSEAHGHKASGAATATPGKQTQVELAAQQAGAQHAAAHDQEQEQEQEDRAMASAASAESGGVHLDKLEAFIGKHEGRVDHVYLDSLGNPTAGIGHLLPRGKYRVGQKVSAAQISSWFRHDVASAIAGAKRDVGPAYDRLDEARRMVVIDMAFNLGTQGFGSFHATIHAIQTGNYAQAASNMLQSLWARQVGHRATEDAAIMRSGHLAGGGGTQVEHGGGGGGSGGHDTGHHGGGGGGGGGGTTLEEVRSGHAVLKIGDHGPAVAKVQHLLHVPADGIFGEQTQHAVEKFQRAHHLAADGIVGSHTIHALDHKAPAKHHTGGGHATGGGGSETGGAEAPSGGAAPGEDHGGGKKHHDKWSPAPPLADVKSGKATLHQGEKGGSVRHVQKLLGVDADGEFGPGTLAAVKHFEHLHHMKNHEGVIDAHTLNILEKHPVGSIEGETSHGSEQRQRMLSVARGASAGKRPDGMCYAHVCQFFVSCGGYGKIHDPHRQFPASALPYAHDFADFVNAQGPKKWGLEKLSISSPYDAPPGAIVVVKAGSPGTHHPTAGDIAIADGHGLFYNGGVMGYSGAAGWKASPRAHLLGAYIPV
jgi:lysozyme